MLPLLLYWLSLWVKKVLMLGKLWAVTTGFFGGGFMGNGILMDFAKACYRPKQGSLLHLIFWSFIGLWVRIRYGKKLVCSKLNPVQCSRCELTTHPTSWLLVSYMALCYWDLLNKSRNSYDCCFNIVVYGVETNPVIATIVVSTS